MARTNGIHRRSIQRYGWVPDLPDARDFQFSAPDEVVASLPPKVDLRSKCPPVYDQGQLGSCTANAIAGAYEFDQRQERQPDFMPSRLFIYFNERTMEGTVDIDAGAMIRDGIKSVAKLGVCTETTWPYDISTFTQKPPTDAYKEAEKHQALVLRGTDRPLSGHLGELGVLGPVNARHQRIQYGYELGGDADGQTDGLLIAPRVNES